MYRRAAPGTAHPARQQPAARAPQTRRRGARTATLHPLPWGLTEARTTCQGGVSRPEAAPAASILNPRPGGAHRRAATPFPGRGGRTTAAAARPGRGEAAQHRPGRRAPRRPASPAGNRDPQGGRRGTTARAERAAQAAGVGRPASVRALPARLERLAPLRSGSWTPGASLSSADGCPGSGTYSRVPKSGEGSGFWVPVPALRAG